MLIFTGMHSLFGGSDGRVCLQCRRTRLDHWVRKVPWKRERQPIPVFLPGESHGQRSLAGYSPWDFLESDRTERQNFHFTLFTAFLPCVFYYTHDIISRKNKIVTCLLIME